MRVKVENKRIINGKTDVNQLVPFKYKWAWDKYLASCANHWMPQEVNMQRDIELWKSADGLTEDERRIVKRNLGFFVTADSLAANNIVLGTYRHITAPECRQFLLRQAFEECYVDGTEVLTTKGWVEFKKLSSSEKIAQFNNGKIEFVAPTHITKKYIKEPVVKFFNGKNSVELVVTKKHRMFYYNEYKKEYGFSLAEEMSYSKRKMVVSGLKNDGEKTKLTPHERFLIALQADGTLLNSGYRNGNVCGTITTTFTLKKQRKIDRIKNILNDCGYKYNISEKDNRGRMLFRVFVPKENYLSKTFDWVDIEKTSSDWAQEFINEVANWDGHINKHGSISYSSKHKENTDILQIMCHISGNFGSYYLKKDNRSEKFSDIHNIYITKRNQVSRGTIKKEEIDYDGMVYCATVPSGALLVRYNNKVSVCGNCIHTHAYQYIAESLGLDEGEIFNAYKEIKSIKDKDDFLMPFIDVLTDPNFKTGTLESDQQLLKSMIVFACLMEGLFFYVGFTQILAMGRQNKMVGAAEQYMYILRDESMHCNFGIDLINQLKIENPHLWTEPFRQEITQLFLKAVELEYRYAEDTMPRGVLGLNAPMFKQYLRYIANRRAQQIGLDAIFAKEENPFPWMSEMIDLKKERNFFETRVIEYQTGTGLSWE